MKDISNTNSVLKVQDFVGAQVSRFLRWAVTNFGSDFISGDSTLHDGQLLMQFGFSPEFVAGLNDLYSNSRDLELLGITSNIMKIASDDTQGPWILGQLSLFAPMFDYGLKIFEPDSLCCEALANTKPLIPFAEYEQPFPTMMIRLPAEFRRKYSADTALPEFVGIRHRKFENEDGAPDVAIQIVGTTPGSEDITSTFVSSIHSTIEAGLGFVRNRSDNDWQFLPNSSDLALNDYTDDDWDANTLIQRVAINACLLLTQYGYTTRPALSKGQLRKLRRKAAKKRSESARIQLGAPTEYVSLQQEINWFRSEPSDRQSDSDSGVRLRPHWRKGHYKMQPYGKGRTKRKRVFIKPYLVNGADYGGRPEDARSVYR